jgi:hypothetical protein
LKERRAAALSFRADERVAFDAKRRNNRRDWEPGMRKLLLAAVLVMTTPVAANAATWIAACTDGQDLQYNQTIGGKGVLYLENADGTYQSVALVQNSYNGNVICSVAAAKPQPGAAPVVTIEVCADKAHNTITLKYKDPTGTGRSIDDSAPYCTAAVTVH